MPQWIWIVIAIIILEVLFFTYLYWRRGKRTKPLGSQSSSVGNYSRPSYPTHSATTPKETADAKSTTIVVDSKTTESATPAPTKVSKKRAASRAKTATSATAKSKKPAKSTASKSGKKTTKSK